MLSVHLAVDQYEAIKALADFHGESVTSFMEKVILDQLEDEEDYQEAVKNVQDSHGETVSRQEIMNRLGVK
ncbi:type II toxin-antitoxin system RelB family antitoxin [Levilactobacillus cerevisiae]|uniref:type II toxin-antitoxin system RelB family antitoxin n=1 Tax=Levilactobacillus cerevisiae TaxID=1704076 RepID=UPI001CDD10C0|nr:DUF6290 family protein [Levilactobacillus cerevisiae]